MLVLIVLLAVVSCVVPSLIGAGGKTTPSAAAAGATSQTDTPGPSFTPTTWARKPTWSAVSGEPSGRIIYTCQIDKNPGHDQICMINADGSGFRQLTEDPSAAHSYPSWAPDGNGYYYTAVHQRRSKIFYIGMDGKAQLLGQIPGDLYAPVPSPDGMRVVFTRHADDTTRFISVYDHEEDVFQDLTNFFGDGDPVWSPDGSKILFLSGQDNNAQLYFMNADGTFIQQITQLTGLRGRPDWASNLAIVTYGGEAEEHNREIILLTISGEPRYITEGGDNLAPSFSPDGQWIVFVSYRDHFWEADGCELYLMRRDGTDVRRLTQNDYCDDQPRWGQ